MADLKGSAATVVTTLSDTTRLLASDAATDKVVTGAQIKSYLGDAVYDVATADQVVGASTTAYITDSGIVVPTGKLRIGSAMRWQIALAKSAASTAGLTFTVRVGTAGTTADTARVSFAATSTQTAAADEGIVDIIVTCRGPLSASGIFEGTLRLTHDLAATGLANKAMDVKRAQSAAFDVTTAGLIVGIAMQTGASHSITIRQCIAEAINL